MSFLVLLNTSQLLSDKWREFGVEPTRGFICMETVTNLRCFIHAKHLHLATEYSAIKD